VQLGRAIHQMWRNWFQNFSTCQSSWKINSILTWERNNLERRLQFSINPQLLLLLLILLSADRQWIHNFLLGAQKCIFYLFCVLYGMCQDCRSSYNFGKGALVIDITFDRNLIIYRPWGLVGPVAHWVCCWFKEYFPFYFFRCFKYWEWFDHYGVLIVFFRLVMLSCLHGPKAVQESLSGSTGKRWNLIMFQKICIIGLTSSLDINREGRWVSRFITIHMLLISEVICFLWVLGHCEPCCKFSIY